MDWAAVKAVLQPSSADLIWEQAWNAFTLRAGRTYGEFLAALTQAADESRLYGQEFYGVLDLLDYMIQREIMAVSGVSLAGTVSHAVTGAPLVYTSIRLQHIDTDEIATTTSWYDGRFLFRTLPSGTYRLTVEAYRPSSWDLVYVPGTGLPEPLAVTVIDGASVEGRITGGQTDLVAG